MVLEAYHLSKIFYGLKIKKRDEDRNRIKGGDHLISFFYILRLFNGDIYFNYLGIFT